MWVILRAFAWLRWRMLINAFERTGSRDTLERFSIAIEKVGPMLAGLLLVPSAAALGVGSIVAGYMLAASPERAVPFEIARYALLLLFIMAALGPIVLPSGDRTNPVRLLLLPIPRRTLYLTQAAATFGDPWLLLALPLLAGLPLGLAGGGAWGAALAAALGGLLLAAVLAGVATVSALVLHMLSRDRRRGELVALVFVVVLPLLALLPSLMAGERRDGERRRAPLSERLPSWVGPVVDTGFAALPSELHVRASRRAAQGAAPEAVLPLAALALTALLVHGAGLAAFGRVLDGPSSSSSRRTGELREVWTRRLPLLSPAASAIALGHLRLALRTPRGRAILLSPLLMFALFSALMWQGGGAMRFGPFAFTSGLALATFATAAALLSVLPIAMNQFAVDGAGLTLVLLSPVRAEDYLAGKAAGNVLVTLVPVLLALPLTLLLFPGGSPALWLSLPLGLAATWLVAAPVAAILSAVFPRAVDMNSVSRGSNAHGAAGLLGILAFALAALPAIGAVALAVGWLRRPDLAVALLAGWTALAAGLYWTLSRVALRVFLARRENLAMTIR